MRILQIATSLTDWGGIERYITYLAEGLTNLGHRVEVACQAGSPLDVRVSTPKVLIGTPNRFRLTMLPAYMRLFSDERYDVVQTHFSPDFLVPAIAARRCRQPRIIMSRHLALPWTGMKAKSFGALYDLCIPVSDSVKDSLRKSGFPARKLRTAHMGLSAPQITCTREVARERLGMARETFAVAFLGRIEPEKGLETLVRAAAAVGSVSLYIVGDGSARSAAVKLSEALEMGERVHFLGYLSDVGDALQAMDALVVPSLWPEAFSAVILEAMSLGVPVIASNVGGTPELIRTGVNGLLYPPGNVAELASSILQLKGDNNLRQQFISRGKAIQASEYSILSMAERFQKIFSELPAAR